MAETDKTQCQRLEHRLQDHSASEERDGGELRRVTEDLDLGI